jgi:dephospho-CoA kinase
MEKDYYKRVYGLTGSIACGKTFVAEIFKSFGVDVLDLDKVSRDVVKKGEKGLKLIIENFGKGFLDENGELDRKKLGELIFRDRNAKKLLEKILHPIIFEKEREFVKNHRNKYGFKPLIIDAALMIETKSYKRYEKIIVVYVPENIQIDRLMNRDNISYNDVLLKIRSQMSIEEKIKYADFIIDNSDGFEFTKKQVKDILEVL